MGKKRGCGQWIHEECVENAVTDMNGVVRCCSNCVDYVVCMKH